MDFSALYNTPLSPEEEAAYQSWAEQNGKTQDVQDYDLRGFYKSQGQFSDNGHAPDTFKKPNHPTFSNQSIYNGASGLQGGEWTGQTFTPSQDNLLFHSPEQLQQYFDSVEPEAQIKFKALKEKLR